jgi:hypothetical protein
MTERFNLNARRFSHDHEDQKTERKLFPQVQERGLGAMMLGKQTKVATSASIEV